jgi:hypothetical protein
MLQVTTGKVKKPVLMALFGVESVGKTEFCTKFPSPLFIDYEGGSENYDTNRLRPSGYFEVKQFLETSGSLKDYKTLVIDSLDWLERAMYKDMCAKAKVNTVEDLGGYGKWVNVIMSEWSSFIDLLKKIREEQKINIILTAHYHIKAFNDPITNTPYDRYMMKLNDKASALIREWVDMVLFANFETYSKTSSANDKKGKGVGTGVRLFYTEKRPAHDAKNRFSLPYVMPMDYDVLMNHLNQSSEDKLNILRQEISDLLLDVKDVKILETATAFFEKNKNDINQLHSIKNRLMTILGE